MLNQRDYFLHFQEFSKTIQPGIRRGAVAVHLHHEKAQTVPMSLTTFETPVRNGIPSATALNQQLLRSHSEAAFHYFLDIECARAVRSTRRSVLLRVDLKDADGASCWMSDATSERLCLALAESLRETDFIGWYEDQRVAGAVLTEVTEEHQNDSVRRAVNRLRRCFDTHFPVAMSSRLDIRVTMIQDERTWS